MGIIGVGIYSIKGAKFKVFDSHARDVYGNGDPEGKCVLLETPSIDHLVQYFQSLYRNQEIYMSLKVSTFATLKRMFVQAILLKIVVYSRIVILRRS